MFCRGAQPSLFVFAKAMTNFEASESKRLRHDSSALCPYKYYYPKNGESSVPLRAPLEIH